MYKRKKVAVVVPAYNEERFIKNVIETIPDYVDKIYAVDDGSMDSTPKVLNEIEESRLVIVKHEKNRGVGAAIASGYKKALSDQIDIVAVMAGDGQMDPKYLSKLLDPVIEGKVAYAKGNRLISREYINEMPRWRFFGNALLTFFTKIATGYWHITDPQNGYTAISSEALKTIDVERIYPYYGCPNDILVKLNVHDFSVVDVPIPARYGDEKSKIRHYKYIVKVSWLLLKSFFWRLKVRYMIYDFHPLVLFYILGMILTPAGVLMGLWIFFQRFLSVEISLNMTILATLLLIMGLQFVLFAMLFDSQENRNQRLREYH